MAGSASARAAPSRLSRLGRRARIFLPAVATLLFFTGCLSTRVSQAPGIEQVAAMTLLPTPVSTPTPEPTPSSPCVPFITPQPTLTPSAHSPAPAFEITPSAPVLTGKSELREATFYSSRLGEQKPVLIYLPPGYSDSTRRYPVLYMLSGFSGDRHEWVNWGMCQALEQLIRGGYIQPLIVVMPEGDKSWWFNHAPVPGSDGKPYGDYVWSDVVDYVDGNYRTLPRPTSRAIGGLSAGGQAALSLSLTHPEVFAIVGAHSPSVRHADGSLAMFGDPAYFNQYDIVWLLNNTQTWKQLTIWLDTADEDTQWGPADHDLHNLMVSLGVPHEYQDNWHGIHDDYYWSAHISDYLLWYSSKLAKEDIQ